MKTKRPTKLPVRRPQIDMDQRRVAAAIDLEYRLYRLYSDAREALAACSEITGPHGLGFEQTYDVMRAIQRAQEALDEVFRLAGDIDRATKGEPPF